MAKPALNLRPISRILDPIGPVLGPSPPLRAHSCLQPLHDSLAHHPQVGKRKHHQQLAGVLGQAPIANLAMPELALDDPKRMLDLGADAGLDLLQLLLQRVARPALVHRPALARHHGDVPIDVWMLGLNFLALVNTPVARIGKDLLFFNEVVAIAQQRDLLSGEHFSVDGTLIQAWAGHKSFVPKAEKTADADKSDGDSGGSAAGDFKGQRRSNETHESKTDGDARLYRKGNTASELRYMGHTLSDNRHGLIANAMVTKADGYAEREAAKAMIHDARQALGDEERAITLGADKGYDAKEFIDACQAMKVTPHVAQNKSGRQSAVPEELLQQVNAQHHFGGKRRTPRLACRRMRRYQGQQLGPRYHQVHLIQELTLARALGDQLESGAGKAHLFHG
jgi:hypothetical protein